MKKRGLIIIALVVIVMITATGCFSPKPWFLDFKKSHSVDEEKKIDLSELNIEKLELELLSNEINISKSSSDEIEIYLTGSIKSNFTPDIYIDKSGSNLRISDSNKSFSNSNYKNNSLNIEILIPEKFHEDFNLNTIISIITIEGIDFNDVGINSISGNIRLSEIKGSNTNLKSVSGNIDVSDSNLYNLRLDTVSGDSMLIGVNANNLRAKSVSGDLDIIGDIGSFNFDTVSGDASLNIYKVEQDFTIKSVSGSAKLIIEKLQGFDFRYSSLSGDIESDKELNYDRIHDDTIEGSYGTGGSLVYFKSTSGDFIIK